MKCPKCNKEIEPESEDQRFDSDRGLGGEIIYWCPECDEDLTEHIP